MKGRLLIVDDERGILLALKGLFSKEGYEVETAESGEEALQKVKAGPFHVDHHRPQHEGDERARPAARGARARPGLRGADDHRVRHRSGSRSRR